MCECCCKGSRRRSWVFKVGDHVRVTPEYHRRSLGEPFHGTIERGGDGHDVVIVRKCHSFEKTHLSAYWLEHSCTEESSFVSRIFSRGKCSGESEADTIRDARYRYINGLPSELAEITKKYNELSGIDKAKDFLRRG